MQRAVNAIRKFARRTLATVRDDFLDAVRSTTNARESITCYAHVIVPRRVVRRPETLVDTSTENLSHRSCVDAESRGNGTYGDGNLGYVGYTG